jgi:CHASE3 domain sensor protein
MKFKKQIFLAAGVVLILQVLVAGIVYSSISTLLKDTKWVEHTYKVIGQANQLKRFMIDQETGMRGHAVTGVDDFLEPYRSGYIEFTALITELKETVSDNPPQVKRLEVVATLATQWRQNVAERYITLRQNILKGEHLERDIQQLISSGVGKQMMDALRQQVAHTALEQKYKPLIVLDLVNMETGLRGFLLNEDEKYLEPYNQSISVLDKHLQEAGASWELKAAVNTWKNEYAEKLIVLAKDEAKTADMDELYIEFETKEGKRYMDKIRQELARFIDVEQQLLTKRLNSQSATSFYAKVAIIVGIFLAFIVGIMVIARIARNILTTQELQQQKLQSDTELKLLKAQVDSHFLFNTLNTIYYTAAKDPKLSRQLVMDLSNLMRVNLKRQEELCSLQAELDHVDRYLRIEKVRFQDKLQIEQRIDLDADAVRLPMFSIQTLVENAIKHGISNSLNGGKVTIHCYRQDDVIYIDVHDTANTLDQSLLKPELEKSLGLTLVRDRLKQYSDYKSELQLFSDNQLTTARIILK